MANQGARDATAATFRGSVVIPAHDAAATICAQLDSLAVQQGDLDLEVIVVANRCSDGTAEVVERYRADGGFPYELQVVRADERAGASYARNVGIEHASTEQILACDADDLVVPVWAAQLGPALDDAELASGVLVRWDSLAYPDPSTIVDPRVTDHAGSPYLGFLPFAPGGNHAVRRSVWKEIGGWDEEILCEDVDFPWRVQLAGGSMVIRDEAVVYHRQHDTLARMLRQRRTWGKGEVELFRKFREHGLDLNPAAPQVLINMLGYHFLTSYRLLTSRRREWMLAGAKAVGRVQAAL